MEGFEAFEKKLKKIPSLLVKNARTEINNSMRDFQIEMQNRMRAGDGGLSRRNGALARSFHVVPATGNDLFQLEATATIGGASAPYAVIQEFGGTVRPTRGQFLAVPILGALTKAGRLKQSMVGFLGQIPNVFIATSKVSGKATAFQRVSKRRAVPIATLRRYVTMRPRLGFFDTWNKLKFKREVRMRSAFSRALKGDA